MTGPSPDACNYNTAETSKPMYELIKGIHQGERNFYSYSATAETQEFRRDGSGA